MTAVTIPLSIVIVLAPVLVVMVTFAPVPLPPPGMLAKAGAVASTKVKKQVILK